MKTGKRRFIWRCRATLVGLAFLLTLAASYRVEAAYVRRFCTVANGGITFTGNTLGLDKANGSNTPGAVGSIGTFSTTNTGVRETASWPLGTTATWTLNSSMAVLSLPVGATVLYAELVWSGSYNYGGEDVSASLNSPVNFTTPLGGPYSVTPDPATYRDASPTRYLYTRSAEVTSYVQAAGAGNYTVGRVPATQGTSENNLNCAGWVLAVIYEEQSLPARSITFFVGGELAYSNNPTTISIVDGFRTAQTGAVNGRLLVSALEGDVGINGDQMLFGETTDNMNAVSGPNNQVNNFFAAQINGDNGLLNTSGTHGTRNHSYSGTYNGARQGIDITNVGLTAPGLHNNQTSAVVRGNTTGDTYYMTTVGLQVDIGAPRFPRNVMTVDKNSTVVGDTLTYTVRLDNTLGTADAVNLVFTDALPWGLEFVPGSLTIDGVPQPGANPENGVPIDLVAYGDTVTLTYRANVMAVPIAPAVAEYRNTASWTYQFQSAPVLPLHNGQVTTDPPVVVTIPRLTLSKTVSANGPGTRLTYTITTTNTGTGATAGTTLRDPIPAGTTYRAGTTTLNGVAVADVGGAMPFANARAINSAGAGGGIIAVGASAVVVFQVNRTPPAVITNTAYVDPDGGGPLPSISDAVTYPTVAPPQANLGVAITDGQASVVAGSAMTYTVTVSNAAGSASVNGFVLAFTLPAGLAQVLYTPATGTYDEYTGRWTGLTLAAGGSVSMTVAGVLSPSATGSITATAVVSHLPETDTVDPNAANNTASDIDNVLIQADLSVSKTDGRAVVVRGEDVTYAITVTNAGPSRITALYLTDTFPADLDNPVFTPQVGVYNSTNHLWNGLNLDPGEAAVIELSGTVASDANGTLENVVNVAAPSGATDPNNTNNEARDTDTILLSSLSISGYVYHDLDHDAARDWGEPGTGIAGLYAKLAPAAGGDALQAVAVDALTGVYQFINLSADTYTIILDNNATLSDTTPFRPADWIGTEAPGQSRGPLTITTVSIAGQNIGLWYGAKVTGAVFRDDGAGGGTPNDGVRNGGEAGLAGVRVQAEAGGNRLDTITTSGAGGYTLWIGGDDAGQVAVVESDPGGYISVGGAAGDTGGSYDRAQDRTVFTCVAGVSYTGVNFADVSASTLSPGAVKEVMAGAAVFFPHVFTAGTAGTVSFGVSCAASPAAPSWTAVIYLDVDGDGQLDPGEVEFQPRAAVAGERIYLLLKVYVPAGAPPGARAQIALTANFTLTNASPPLNLTMTVTDTAVMVTPPTSGLNLSKSVDKQYARPGEEITYTITYTNISGSLLSAFVITDATPTYTTFVLASYGPLPPNLSACVITSPAISAAGSITWTFSGNLAPGASGTVIYRVMVMQ